MHVATVNSFDQWRHAARSFLVRDVPPQAVHFSSAEAQESLFTDTESAGDELPEARGTAFALRVPKRFMEIARRVVCHRDRGRFELLYRLLWRITHGERHLLEIETDDDVHRMNRMDQAIRRDAHKMKAFVRFRRVEAGDGSDAFIAWHRPDHRIAQLVAPFFARRFPAMNWSILTPDESVAWDQNELAFGPGVSRSEAPTGDELEELWRTYYASIFNPARIKLKAMVREMPKRHWPTLPETELIPDLLADAPRRVAEMIERGENRRRSAADFLPEERTYEQLRDYAARCQGCDLYCDATQTVFGEGPVTARLMIVGEQPGDMEDLAGRPFVGPAGDVFNDALEQAGLHRSEIYLTNAVKHFKFVLRGKKRLHKKPGIREAVACRPWLVSEIELVRPQVLLCLGATAAQSLMGTDFRITCDRGKFVKTSWCHATIASYHPSAVLRAPDETRRNEVFAALLADLAQVAQRLKTSPFQALPTDV